MSTATLPDAYPTQGTGQYNELFNKIGFDSFYAPSDKPIITIPSTTSIAETVKILSQHGILSAPIVDVTQEAGARYKYTGVADFISAVDWMMNQTWGHAPTDLHVLRGLKEAFNTTPVTRLAACARWAPFVPIDPNETSLVDVITVLGYYGCHRTWLVNSPGGDITGVISQADVLKMIADRLEQFPELVDHTLTSLGLGHKTHVFSVHAKDTYWDAFKLMSQTFVSAVAIINDAGEMVGVLSSHDLREMILSPAKFATMPRPIGTFNHGHIRTHDLITCKKTDKLSEVIKKFEASHVHRIFVLDDHNHPTAVVSLRDVITRFVKAPKDSKLIAQYFSPTVSA